MKPWLCLQTGTLQPGDDLSQYGAVQIIADWEQPTKQLIMDRRIHVGMWRWTQDPRSWSGWPVYYITVCPLAVFWNEPDVEGPPPAWYESAVISWQHAGGSVIEPAWSNEAHYRPDGLNYQIVSAHDYANTFSNLSAVRARSNGRRVILTEYGHAHQQQRYLVELGDAHVSEQSCLFAWRWEGNTDAGYDLAGITLSTPPLVNQATYCTEIGPDGSGHNRCGAACLADALLTFGWQSDPWGLTLDVTGKALGLSGPATPDQTIPGGLTSGQMIQIASQYGRHAQTWSSWYDGLSAIEEGKVVLLLLDNWDIRPRAYPLGQSFDALHWIRLVGEVDQPDLYLCHDPLCWLVGEYPVAYQGPTIYTLASLKQAVAATGLVESGIWVE